MNKLDNRMMDLADYFAETQKYADPRAWEHLLVYCPMDILERVYVDRSRRRWAQSVLHAQRDLSKSNA